MQRIGGRKLEDFDGDDFEYAEDLEDEDAIERKRKRAVRQLMKKQQLEELKNKRKGKHGQDNKHS